MDAHVTSVPLNVGRTYRQNIQFQENGQDKEISNASNFESQNCIKKRGDQKYVADPTCSSCRRHKRRCWPSG